MRARVAIRRSAGITPTVELPGEPIASCQRDCDGINEDLDDVSELFGDTVTDRSGIPKIVWDEAAEVDRVADAEEDVALGQLARPFGPIDLPLQFEDHLRQPLLRRVHIRVLRLPAPHLADTR